jgi:4'-phosphopantetheinyl transferase EntD
MRDEFRLTTILQTMADNCHLTAYAIQVGPLESFSNAPLFPTEISPMSPRRRATFQAGRACAHAALKELGSPDLAIPIGPSGAPVWPPGFVGSITHTNDVAAAIVAPSEKVRGVGLDIETDEPFDHAEIVRMVCRPEELLPGRDLSDPANLEHAKLLFVIKESVYKLYRPLCDAFLEFHDLSVSLDESTAAFQATLVNPQRPALAGNRTITGNSAKAESLFIALASLT